MFILLSAVSARLSEIALFEVDQRGIAALAALAMQGRWHGGSLQVTVKEYGERLYVSTKTPSTRFSYNEPQVFTSHRSPRDWLTHSRTFYNLQIPSENLRIDDNHLIFNHADEAGLVHRISLVRMDPYSRR